MDGSRERDGGDGPESCLVCLVVSNGVEDSGILVVRGRSPQWTQVNREILRVLGLVFLASPSCPETDQHLWGGTFLSQHRKLRTIEYIIGREPRLKL